MPPNPEEWEAVKLSQTCQLPRLISISFLLVSNILKNLNSFIGGANATAITKFIQCDTEDYKMALISNQGKFVLPQAYFGVCHEHIAPLKLESGTVSSQVKPWSRTDVGAQVVKYLPE